MREAVGGGSIPVGLAQRRTFVLLDGIQGFVDLVMLSIVTNLQLRTSLIVFDSYQQRFHRDGIHFVAFLRFYICRPDALEVLHCAAIFEITEA
jgi:hypothetical protein